MSAEPVVDTDEESANARRIITALTFQKIGDRIADPKTVLAWLLATLAVPTLFAGLLVPVRESGSLLPQAVLIPRVKQQAVRKRVWMAGAVGQSIAVAGMAAVAVGLRGTVAGVAILTCLAAFALSRALSSIAYKDVLGRTISKGDRGRVGGIASAFSGVVAIVLGLGLRQLGPESGATVLAIALAGASGLWLLATLTFGLVQEPAGGAEESDKSGLVEAWTLLRSDRPFRKFVTTRALLLVSALSPPFVVILASSGQGAALSGLGAFVIAQGLAAMLGGRSWGVMADRSSRLTMVAAATAASVAIAAFLVVDMVVDGTWLYPLAYFLIALAHEGVRLGRSTYVTDMAEGNQRTAYVAASNTAMGALLLVAGVITSGLALLGPRAALVFLLLGGLAGAWNGLRLPEVSAG